MNRPITPPPGVPSSVKKDEVKAAHMVIAAICKQQGGVISVTEEELEGAVHDTIDVSQLGTPPGVWLIKVIENGDK